MTANEIKTILLEKWNANGFETTYITANGYQFAVTPCSSCYPTTSIEQVEFYLVDGPLPWLSDDSLDKICGSIASIDKLMQDQQKDENALWEYVAKYKNSEDFDFGWFSDWHKDVYGYRPKYNPAAVG